jgi:hypothetical protein
VLSGLAALAIAAPHVLALSDRSDESIKLCGTYAAIYRELLDAKARVTAGSLEEPSHVADVIALFERIQERTDALMLPAGDENVPGGLRDTARPLMPAKGTPGRVVAPAAIDADAGLAALVHVLTSRRVTEAQKVPALRVGRRFRFWSRARRREGAALDELASRILLDKARVIPDSAWMQVTRAGDSVHPGAAREDRPGSAMRLSPDAVGVPRALGD